MSTSLSDSMIGTLTNALCGWYEMDAGEVLFIYRPLKGDVAAHAITVDGKLIVVIDLDKPNAIRHARTMLREEGWQLFDDTEDGEELPIVDRAGITRVHLAGSPPPPDPRRGPWRTPQPRAALESVR